MKFRTFLRLVRKGRFEKLHREYICAAAEGVIKRSDNTEAALEAAAMLSAAVRRGNVSGVETLLAGIQPGFITAGLIGFGEALRFSEAEARKLRAAANAVDPKKVVPAPVGA